MVDFFAIKIRLNYFKSSVFCFKLIISILLLKVILVNLVYSKLNYFNLNIFQVTALMSASACGCVEVAENLLSLGASLSLKSCKFKLLIERIKS